MTIDPHRNNCTGSVVIKKWGVRSLVLMGHAKQSPLRRHTPAESNRRTTVVRKRSSQPLSGAKKALIAAQYKDIMPAKNESALERSNSIRQPDSRLPVSQRTSLSDTRQRVLRLDFMPGEVSCARRDMLVECFGLHTFPASAFCCYA